MPNLVRTWARSSRSFPADDQSGSNLRAEAPGVITRPLIVAIEGVRQLQTGHTGDYIT